MKKIRSLRPALLFLVSYALVSGFSVQAQPEPPPGNIQVWTSPSTKVKRVHREGCRRLPDDPEERAKLQPVRTLAEARADGYVLCSRCPGSTTPGKYPKSWVNPPPDRKTWEPDVVEFEPPESAPLVSMGSDGELVYNSFSDKGDRLIDFSYAGYRRSEEPIPDVRTVLTLEPPSVEANLEGNFQYPIGADSTATIQAALDDVAVMPVGPDGYKGAVLLQKGTWYTSDTLLLRSGVVLRGEGDGEDGTVIIVTIPDGRSNGIQVGNGATTQTTVSLTGTVGESDGAERPGFPFTTEDGGVLLLNNPRRNKDLNLEEYAGEKVTIELPLMTANRGRVTNLYFKHTMPYSIQRWSEGDPVHDRPEGMMFPGEKPEEEKMPESRIADSYIPTGATEITVEDASGFKVGDDLVVRKTTNEKWVEVLGVGERLRHIRGGREGAGKRPWNPPTLHHLRTIEAIDGNTLTLDIMMTQSIDAEHGGGTVQKTVVTSDENVGVESIRVVSNYDKTETSNSKQANYGNLKNGIELTCQNGWVRNCTVLHVWYAAVATSDSRFTTVRDCASLEPVGAKRGGKRYTYAVNGGAGNLIYRVYSEDGRHCFVTGRGMTGPFVYLDCESVRGGQSEPHHRWGVGGLWDNITTTDGGSLASINRGDSGSGHGWAGANCVFWNCDSNNITVFDPETEGENNFAIGYTGDKSEGFSGGGLHYANTRSGYWGTPREGKFYGYALMGSGHIESPGSPVEPGSLFKQQLIERIGREAAEAVLK